MLLSKGFSGFPGGGFWWVFLSRSEAVDGKNLEQKNWSVPAMNELVSVDLGSVNLLLNLSERTKTSDIRTFLFFFLFVCLSVLIQNALAN